MSTEEALRPWPLPEALRHAVQALRTPSRVFAAARERQGGGGFGVFLTLLVVEWLLSSLGHVAAGAVQLLDQPGTALLVLWTGLTHYALPFVGGLCVAGIVQYYGARFRKRRVDLWTSIAMLGFTWLPHTLLVALGLIAAGLGFDHALWPQYGFVPPRGVGVFAGAAFCVAKMALAYGPSAVLLGVSLWCTWSAPVTDDSAMPETPRRAWPMALVGALLTAALLLQGLYVTLHWQRFRPLRTGERLQSFQLAGLKDGDFLNSSALQGKVVLVDFWATWCPPCVASMPALERLHGHFDSRDFQLVSVNTEPHDRELVRAFVRKHQLSFPVYVDDGRLQRAWQVRTLPTGILLDRSGEIRDIHVGVVGFEDAREDIERLIAEE